MYINSRLIKNENINTYIQIVFARLRQILLTQ